MITRLKKYYYRYIYNLDSIENKKINIKKNSCGIVVNYKTPDLIKTFLLNFRIYYPQLHLIIVDNSNFDRSSDFIYYFCKKDGNVTLLANMFNFHHGPGLHKAIEYVKDYFKYALIMDSDIVFKRIGMIESMKKIIPKKFISCGKIQSVTIRGMNNNDINSIPYIHPSCMYLNISQYLKLPPAKLHGAPFIDTFSAVKQQGNENLLIDFDVEIFMQHLGRGTVIRTGGYHTKKHPKYEGK